MTHKIDKNSSYLHKRIVPRKKRNRIQKIRDKVGIWREEDNQIRDYFVEVCKKELIMKKHTEVCLND